MKKIYTAISLLVLSAPVFGQLQQFENGSFDTWDDAGTPVAEPSQWSSLKTADPSSVANSAPIVLTQDVGRGGSGYSIALKVISALGVHANGTITNGRVHADFDPEKGYIFTEISDPKWNTPFSSFPDSIIGYYKYTPVSGDKGKMEVVLHSTSIGKLPENGTAVNFVARARYDMTQAQSNWTRFSAPFGYYNQNTPDYMLAVLTSGDSTISQIGSKAWFDDVAFVYNQIFTSTITPLTYTVTNTTGTPITIPYTLSSGSAPVGNLFIAQLSDENGSFANPMNLDTIASTTAGTFTTNIPAQTRPGTAYRVRVIATNNAFQTRNVVANTDDITINLIGNYITPDNHDNPSSIIGQAPVLFTVYENPTADSREWFHADTTTGSIFMPFAPTETGTTLNYTALSSGYQDIICKSVTGIDTITSNEVQVYIGQLGLKENKAEMNDIKVYQKNGTIVIASQQHVGYAVFDALGRKLVSGEVNDNSTTSFQTNGTGLYLVQLSDGKSLVTRKIICNNP